ncbi:MAG: hypothetical protein OEZ39_02030 [Gammaproteobacteria bacterium]|nr:hypothetical protein [Gammaproteobacteria bacterium]MDH5650633.1 hypothetical protein [Gammaproteobacteria bacterium]
MGEVFQLEPGKLIFELYDYFIPVFLVMLLLNIVWLWYFVKKKRIHFPARSSVNILFEEIGASGRSHKSLLTRLGVAKNVLQVTLTDKELWITAPFPFLWIAYYYDGVHRIPIHAVKEATKNHKRVFVKFQRKDGGPGQFELRLKRPDEFLGLLNKLNAS